MLLSKLISDLSSVRLINFVDQEIVNITHDSRVKNTSGVFCALVGKNCDGHDYASSSVKNGSVCVVCEREIKNIKVAQVIVDDVRRAMSLMAKKLNECACDKMKIIGVTGTNGKTTTVNLISSVLRCAGYKVGVIGTMGAIVEGEVLDTGFTTPDPIILHSTFKYMLDRGIEYVVMEVSAHAIDLRKMCGIKINQMVLTNITPEHLDYFGTMENYIHTKTNYVLSENVEHAIVNIDDENICRYCMDKEVTTFGLNNPSDVFAVDIVEKDGMRFVVNACDRLIEIKTDLIGTYNVYNILGTVAVCVNLNISDLDIASGIASAQKVAGRMEVYKVNNKTIIIDFAHTPDGFEQTLSTIKSHYGNNITTLFGCVWYSDVEKRKLMGEYASKYSKKIIISTDNIGNEKFETIAKDIRDGIKNGVEVIEIPDRADAIKRAYLQMRDGEVLALLGKGGERVQKINGNLVEYNETDVLKSLLKIEE